MHFGIRLLSSYFTARCLTSNKPQNVLYSQAFFEGKKSQGHYLPEKCFYMRQNTLVRSMETSFSLTASSKSTLQEWCRLPSRCLSRSLEWVQGPWVVRNSSGCTGPLREGLKCWIWELIQKGFQAPFLPCQAASNLSTTNEFQEEKKAQFSGPLNLWPLYKTHQSCRRAWQAGGVFCAYGGLLSNRWWLVQEGFLVVPMSSVLSLTTWGAFK